MSFRPQPPLMGQPPLPMMTAPFNPSFGVPIPNMPPNMAMPPLPVGTLPPPPVMPGMALQPSMLRPSGQALLPLPNSISTLSSTASSSHRNNNNSSISGRTYHHRDRDRDRRNQDRSEQGGKTTTVFVGNITERASDALVRQILMKCGYISNWKRVQGATGRLQAFGFCEYSSPDSALRSMRLLSDFPLGEKKLLVKVDSKTRMDLDDYKRKKKEEKETESEEVDNDYDVERDPATKTLDDSSMDDINKLVQDNSDVLSGKYEDSLPYMKKSHSGCTENLEGLDMDNAKKNLVSKEIRIFREAYRQEEKERDKDKKERDKERDRKDRGRDRQPDRDHDRDSHRRRDKDRRKGDVDNDTDKDRRSTSRDQPVVAERTKRSKEEEKERIPEKEKAPSDDEDDYEKRRLERKRKDKEMMFIERLKEWEARERKRGRDYDKQGMKDDKKKAEQEEEQHHLSEFLEDYDDDRDDPKYYRGTAFARRFRDREAEVETDARDRQLELEEIEDILRQQAERPHIPKSIEVSNNHRSSDVSVKRDSSPPPPSKFQPALVSTFAAIKEEESQPSPSFPIATTVTLSSSPMYQQTDTMASFDSARSSPVVPYHGTAAVAAAPVVVQPSVDHREYGSNDRGSSDERSPADHAASPATARKTAFGFGMKVHQLPQQNNSKKLDSVFNANDEETKNDIAPKKKLTRLDEEDGGAQQGDAATADSQAGEDKKKIIRELIEKIPTGKDELFAYDLKWDMVDQSLIDRRIKPWVNKKIFQYIGEEEQTLVEFVCSKVLTKCVPKNILEDVSMVLDDEAEVFVVKMWRLLIYETEAKGLGLK